ncbi:MAG TPA: SprT-like domain-containing protein [Pyrinomonadaceae bacterium]|jgi:hypothetical protein|nr:SprT-like domain-containing protein [Pyrinomonadaceae bacterium]
MPESFENLKELYAEAFQIFGPKRKTPEIDVSYYPYVGINHTIRVRNGQVFVRLAEICHDMPLSAHRGLAYILVAKLFRKKVPVVARDAYSDYIKTAEIRDRATETKRTRGRKIITSSKGDAYDLDEIFDSLNRRYFRDALPKPVLTWSARKTYRILGHHDATHDTVVVSKSLDDASVPAFVVEYIVFHEMLHIAHPTKHVNGRRYNHTPAFRRDERKFQYFEEAERWIERSVRRLKRNARRK